MIRTVLVLVLLATPLAAEPMRFAGTVEAAARAEVTTLVDGVVRSIHVGAGDCVRTGQLLFEIEPVEDLASRLQAAEALRDRHIAELADRRLVPEQQAVLRARDATSERSLAAATTDVAVAEAELAIAETDVVATERASSRTRITAPIDGVVDRPRVAPGAFVEAEAGAPLAVIEQLDPIHVAYSVPYADRLGAVAAANADGVADLLEQLEVRITLPGGHAYPHLGRPFQSNTRIDPATGALTTWATFPNPDLILLPGLDVEVRARLRSAP